MPDPPPVVTRMSARIVYDADGTAQMTVEADRISTQVWDGGRALVKLANGGVEDRALHFARVHYIDVHGRLDGQT